MSNIKNKLKLPEKIKEARKSMGLNQDEFGKKLGLSDKAVSTYEVGRAEPSIDMLQKISKLTHRPVSYFIDDDDRDDYDLKIKLANIERELYEVKKLLMKKYGGDLEV